MFTISAEDNRVLRDEIEVYDKAKVSMIQNMMLKEYGSKARRFVEKYNWNDIVDEFEGTLQEGV
jgi:hypothetical protein